jgi:hypothetical protein
MKMLITFKCHRCKKLEDRLVKSDMYVTNCSCGGIMYRKISWSGSYKISGNNQASTKRG